MSDNRLAPLDTMAKVKKNTARKTTGGPFPPGYKQTAEKSTGAPAPRAVLALKSGKGGGGKIAVPSTPPVHNGEEPMDVDDVSLPFNSVGSDEVEGEAAPPSVSDGMGEEPMDEHGPSGNNERGEPATPSVSNNDGMGEELIHGSIASGTEEVCLHNLYIRSH